jgi:hypothetical protein
VSLQSWTGTASQKRLEQILSAQECESCIKRTRHCSGLAARLHVISNSKAD